MVVQHYRWDFVGLSTDTKPTPATSEKVVDGSTFYCSDTSKLYVFCKDNWYERKALGGGGGGTTYTAGDGIDITDDTISIDDDVVATLQELNARIAKGEGAPTTSTEGVVGGLYEDNTNGKLYICTAITPGTDPDPDTYTWAEVGAGGGGGDTVYSTVTTSSTATGGAVYIGNLNASQVEQPDPSTGDSHYKYFWALPDNNSVRPQQSSVLILGGEAGSNSVAIGGNAICRLDNQVAIGATTLNNYSADRGVSIGYDAWVTNAYSLALGDGANATRTGEVNVGSPRSSGHGYNSTDYRVIGGVHDGQLAQDAVTVAQVNATIDAINTALSTNIPHIGASS